ncbi:MAG: DNA/RNA non-specific endonuclease [Kiritimatiellia bacterium]
MNIRCFFIFSLMTLCLPACAQTERDPYHYAGAPAAASNRFGKITLLKNRGYAVGYDEGRRNPAWVAYRLFNVRKPPQTSRQDRFNTDKRTIAKVSDNDYSNSGYSRGHMAPSYALAICYGKKAQREAYLMSNMTPQKVPFNGGPWQELEDQELNNYTRNFGEIWVITGPVYDQQVEKIPGGSEIPDAFFKIIVDEKDNAIRAIAFLMPHEALSQELKYYITSIDRIEQLTGLDFLPGLPDHIETVLEARTAPAPW